MIVVRVINNQLLVISELEGASELALYKWVREMSKEYVYLKKSWIV